MFANRLEIGSPGGMPDGTIIQEQDIEKVLSTRRNPIIADIFHRLDFVERRDSGFKKICEATAELYNYTDDFAPRFVSTRTAFHVVLNNMNYDLVSKSDQVSDQDTDQDERIVSILEFCFVARTRDEMQQHLGISHRDYFRKTILRPLLDSKRLKMTIPNKPNSRNQKYIRT